MPQTRSGLHRAVGNFLSRATPKQPTVAGSIVVGPRRLFCSRRPLRNFRTAPEMSDRFDPAVHRAGRATDVGHGLEAPLRDRTDLSRHTAGRLRGSAPAEEETGDLSDADTSRDVLSRQLGQPGRVRILCSPVGTSVLGIDHIVGEAAYPSHTLPAPAPVARGVLGDAELVPPAGGGVGAARNGSVLIRARRGEASASRPVTWRTGTMAPGSSSTVAAGTPHRLAPELRGRRRQGVPLPVCDRPRRRRPTHRAARSRPPIHGGRDRHGPADRVDLLVQQIERLLRHHKGRRRDVSVSVAPSRRPARTPHCGRPGRRTILDPDALRFYQ